MSGEKQRYAASRSAASRTSSREISALPDRDNPLREVNRPCFLLVSFPNARSGFDRADLQGWLDLFHVMTNDPSDRRDSDCCTFCKGRFFC